MLLLAAAAITMAHTTARPNSQTETPAQHDQRMAWWRAARFGMFIHWGLYSVPAGVWNGKNVPGAAEWLQYTAQVKPRDYEPLQSQFNPVNFNADKWVSIAKNAGMKYIVITSKHHEGFAMWPSKQGTWNIGHTQFHRNPLKELAVACKKQGIRLCFYYSIMDWHNPDYLPRRPWDDRSTANANFERYVQFMKSQLRELLNGDYGPIGILWFDGQWEGTWTHQRGEDLYAFVRKLQPNIIVNNRVEKGGLHDGDYGTPEQTIPANGLPGIDWESCMTMNDTWGFHQNDHDWKSSDTLIKNLILCASEGGNYLLNVGPTSLGEIPQPSIDRLAAVGQWTHQNGEAIYGTHAGPFPKAPSWGRATQRPGKLYLEAFTPGTKIELTGLQGTIKDAYTLVGHKPLKVEPGPAGPTIDATGVDVATPPATVYVVEVEGPISAVIPPVQPMSNGTLELDAVDARIQGEAQYESDKQAIGFWTHASDSISWDVNVAKAGLYDCSVEFACEPGSAGSTFIVSTGGGDRTGVVFSTGSWADFRRQSVGTFNLKQGRQTIRVYASQMPKGAVMNLRSLRFRPVTE